MKRLVITVVVILGLCNFGYSQLISISPVNADVDSEITLTFDASEGGMELMGSSKVYMHSGVITSGPRGEDWENVVGNWGADDGVGEMTQVEGQTNLWEITLSPTAREYYSVAEDETVYRLSMVFRNADGTVQHSVSQGCYEWGSVASNGDLYVDLKVENRVFITSLCDTELILDQGSSVEIAAEAYSEVTNMSLLVDAGNGYTELSSVSSGTTISVDYTPPSTGKYIFKVEATLNGVSTSDSIVTNIGVKVETAIAALPDGLKKGINYHADDSSKTTLVLEAPFKEFVYVVGDFTNWQIQDDYQMSLDTAMDYFWLEIDSLEAGKEFVFQYWIDGTIKIGDPYADKVVDPWNDKFIEDRVYPNLIDYTLEENGIASVLQTDQQPYQWSASEDTWVRPAKEDLVVYELLVRDFVGSHYYQDVIDSLDYLKRMGVNAIELMPIMEFEGNSSWGYNPSYFFAPDKYYGTKDDLKTFIEVAHQKGFAVILDMVLNHAFGQCPLVRMYWDGNQPAANSPWFNQVARHPFNVGFDFNHESAYTKAFMDSVNRYWIEEYHFDGYRFDLSKGFTQKNTGDDVGAWSAYDISRVALLRRMNNKITSYDSTAYVILEHFADSREENELGAEGMLLWRNAHGSFNSALAGSGGSLSNASSNIHVSYMESHDEQRMMYGMLTDGQSSGTYSTRDVPAALERSKMGAAFLFFQYGPKMLWQFGELGYDLDINFNGRTGEKPLPWGSNGLGYYESELRQYTYDAYAAIINLRTKYQDDIIQENITADLGSSLKTLVLDGTNIDIAIVGNFGLEEANAAISLTKTGTWYDYFSGEALDITAADYEVTLAPGEFRLLTDKRESDGFDNVIVPYNNPLNVDPPTFNLDTEITLTLDATSTTPSLADANEIYMVAGLVGESASSSVFAYQKGDLSDNSIGQLSNVDGSTWEITLTPGEYFDVPDNTDIFRLGVYFRDGDGTTVGYGYREDTIFLSVNPDGNVITVEPDSFYTNQEIRLIYDATYGTQALLGEEKIYMHSGVVLSDIESPSGGDWANVVGNWGEDDGLGEMTNIDGTNKWEIFYTPASYYSLTQEDSVYWLSMVFRNADGSKQTSMTPGTFDQVFVADNGDIFYDVTPPVEDEKEAPLSFHQEKLSIYPNPVSDFLTISGVESGLPAILKIFNASGKEIYATMLKDRVRVNVSEWEKGLYFVNIIQEDHRQTFRIIIK